MILPKQLGFLVCVPFLAPADGTGAMLNDCVSLRLFVSH